VFSDPPINLAHVEKRGSKLVLGAGMEWSATGDLGKLKDGAYEMGLRPHHILPFEKSAKGSTLSGRVLVTEISGSESVVHFDVNGKTWVSQASGVHGFKVGEIAHFQANVARSIFFTPEGKRVL
jgi:glycerol transport system ATP-binding protein